MVKIPAMMLLKCPKCKTRAVEEIELSYMTWKRSCGACGFIYTIKAVDQTWEPPKLTEAELLDDMFQIAIAS